MTAGDRRKACKVKLSEGQKLNVSWRAEERSGCLVVDRVETGGLGARLGFSKGARLYEIDASPVRGMADFEQKLEIVRKRGCGVFELSDPCDSVLGVPCKTPLAANAGAFPTFGRQKKCPPLFSGLLARIGADDEQQSNCISDDEHEHDGTIPSTSIFLSRQTADRFPAPEEHPAADWGRKDSPSTSPSSSIVCSSCPTSPDTYLGPSSLKRTAFKKKSKPALNSLLSNATPTLSPSISCDGFSNGSFNNVTQQKQRKARSCELYLTERDEMELEELSLGNAACGASEFASLTTEFTVRAGDDEESSASSALPCEPSAAACARQPTSILKRRSHVAGGATPVRAATSPFPAAELAPPPRCVKRTSWAPDIRTPTGTWAASVSQSSRACWTPN
eukprot:gene6528-9970_t